MMRRLGVFGILLAVATAVGAYTQGARLGLRIPVRGEQPYGPIIQYDLDRLDQYACLPGVAPCNLDLATDTNATRLPASKLPDDDTTAGLCQYSGGPSADPYFAACPSGGGGGGGYSTLQNAGIAIAQQGTLNFTSGITCVNNAGASRSDCTPTDIALGSQTAGPYLASVSMGPGLTCSGCTGLEGATPALSIGNAAITPNMVQNSGKFDGAALTYSAGTGNFYWDRTIRNVQDEGIDLSGSQYQTLNFIGSAISCAENFGQSRIDCTVTGGGGGGTEVTAASAAGADNLVPRSSGATRAVDFTGVSISDANVVGAAGVAVTAGTSASSRSLLSVTGGLADNTAGGDALVGMDVAVGDSSAGDADTVIGAQVALTTASAAANETALLVTGPWDTGLYAPGIASTIGGCVLAANGTETCTGYVEGGCTPSNGDCGVEFRRDTVTASAVGLDSRLHHGSDAHLYWKRGGTTGNGDLVQTDKTSRRVVTITDPKYGGVGDDATDNAAAFSAALTDACLDGAGEVHFPAGTYRFTTAITVGSSTCRDVTLTGVGADNASSPRKGSWLSTTAALPCLVTFRVANGRGMGGGARDLGFLGNDTATSAICVDNWRAGQWKHLNVRGFAGYGITLTASQTNGSQNLWSEFNRFDDIDILGQNTGVTILGGLRIFDSNIVAGTFPRLSDNYVTNLYVSGYTEDALRLEDTERVRGWGIVGANNSANAIGDLKSVVRVRQTAAAVGTGGQHHIKSIYMENKCTGTCAKTGVPVVFDVAAGATKGTHSSHLEDVTLATSDPATDPRPAALFMDRTGYGTQLYRNAVHTNHNLVTGGQTKYPVVAGVCTGGSVAGSSCCDTYCDVSSTGCTGGTCTPANMATTSNVFTARQVAQLSEVSFTDITTGGVLEAPFSGTQVFCKNCKPTDPCTGSGSIGGVVATYTAGIWHCRSVGDDAYGTGTCTFSGGTTCTVSGQSFPDTNYLVTLEPDAISPGAMAVGSRTTSGFTITATSNNSAAVRWRAEAWSGTTTTTSTSTSTTTTTATSTTTSTTLVGSAAPDWTSSMVALYHFDDASNGTRTNVGACGGTTSNCNLTDVNANSPLDTTSGEYVEPTGAVTLQEAATSEYLSCPFTGSPNCNAVNFTGARTMGAWFRPTVVDGTNGMTIVDTSDAGSTGGQTLYSSSGSPTKASCRWVGTGGGSETDSSAVVLTANRWAQFACLYTGTNAEIHPFGGASTSTDARTSNAAPTSSHLVIGGTGTYGYTGQVDEAWVYSGSMTANSLCKITQCGVDGKFCRCSGAAFATCSVDADCGPQTGVAFPAKCTGTKCQGRNVGFCAGGSNIGLSCQADSDCPTSTCTICNVTGATCNASTP